jgi:hypothetical protein
MARSSPGGVALGPIRELCDLGYFWQVPRFETEIGLGRAFARGRQQGCGARLMCWPGVVNGLIL